MSNLDKLKSKVDLKNVDASQLTEALSEHQNSLIKLVLILGSLLLIVLMFNDHHVKDQAIRVKMGQVDRKLEALKARDVSIQDLDHFKSKVPKKLNEFELITLISNDAKLYHVNISSLSPAESKNMGLYDVINISFNVGADNFKDMMLFLRKIEKAEFPITVDSWSGHEEDSGRMTFEIEISGIIIHT